MEGLRIPVETNRAPEFPRVLKSAIHRLTSHFWFIDVQAGPFNITDKPNFFELDAEIERYRVRMPELENTSAALWRPGIFPRYEELFWLDEWTYLICLRGPEADAIAAAKEVFTAQYLTLTFFDLLESLAATFLLYVDGWWEVFSSDDRLLEELKELKDVSVVQSSKWLQDGSKG